MFNGLKNKKFLAGGAALLIAGGIAFFLWKPEVADKGLALAKQAWRAAFGGIMTQEMIAEVPLPPSSTLSNTFGQEFAADSDSSAWPSLLKGPSPAGSSKKAASKVASQQSSSINKGTSQKTASKSGSSGQDSDSGDSPATVLSINKLEDGSDNVPAQVSRPPAPIRWCDFSTVARAEKDLILNEIAWMGSPQSANEEWLELKNVSDRAIPVGGWQLLDQNGSIKISFAATTTIAASQFFSVARGTDYSGALANTGAWLKLFDDGCRGVDEINASDGWPAGNNTTKQTLERDVNGNGWHTSTQAGGSLRAQNSIVVASPTTTSSGTSDVHLPNISAPSSAAPTSTEAVPHPTSSVSQTETSTSSTHSVATSSESHQNVSHVLIAAIQITGGAGASNQDYVQIYNPTSQDIDMSGWKLRKRTKTGAESSMKVFPDGSMIAVDNYFVWANSDGDFALSVNANVTSTQTLANDNSIALLDAEDVVVDAVAWGSGHANPFVEGHSYPANPEAGQVLNRKISGELLKDTDNNEADFGIR